MSNKCNPKEPQTCQLSYKGNQCKLLNFELSPDNLAFDKCENFPKILEKFIGCVGLDVFKTIASKAVGGAGDTGTGAPYYNDYQGALKVWQNLNNYVFCGLTYKFDLSICRTNGEVIFDSDLSQSQLVSAPLMTADMEVQAASETQWGAQRRYETSVAGSGLVAHRQLYSAWLAGVNLSAYDSSQAIPAVTTPSIDTCDKRTEVINIRLALEVDSCNNFLPSVAHVNPPQ
jgi:hypothetical protein